MRPEFNIAGPCDPSVHYMLPPERRLGDVLELIEDREYFTLHAGRQTGKSTCMQWLEGHLNALGQVRAIYVNIDAAREKPDPTAAMRSILDSFMQVPESVLPESKHPIQTMVDEWLQQPETVLLRYLQYLCTHETLPLVLLFDHVDQLTGDAMASFLTQIRQGFIERHGIPFPSSMALVGMQRVGDALLATEQGNRSARWGTMWSFNITAEAMTLGMFTAADVEELLLQHTAKTGQRFEPDAIALIYELGQGHPWLTNAIADQIVRKDLKDRTLPITATHVEAAKETIILDRRSHIDSLIARLREDRVRRILDPMLSGKQSPNDVLHDDFAYVLGLGLIRKIQGQYRVANPIYREVIPRALNYDRQMQIWNEPAWYVRKDGSLDMGKLMTDWQTFWRPL